MLTFVLSIITVVGAISLPLLTTLARRRRSQEIAEVMTVVNQLGAQIAQLHEVAAAAKPSASVEVREIVSPSAFHKYVSALTKAPRAESVISVRSFARRPGLANPSAKFYEIGLGEYRRWGEPSSEEDVWPPELAASVSMGKPH